MAFTALTSPQCDADSPVDETLMQLIRTNFDDHESRLSAIFSVSSESILSDFTQSANDAATWTPVTNTGGIADIQKNPHYARARTAGAGTDYGYFIGAAGKIRFKLDTAHSIVVEGRVKGNGSELSNYFWGVNDDSLTGANPIADQTDCIGFTRGTAGTWKFITAKGGAGGASVDGLGTQTVWATYKITITRPGGVPTVAVLFDGSAISGSPFTTNIPDTVTLMPVFGVSNTGSHTIELDMDRYRIYPQASPDSA